MRAPALQGFCHKWAYPVVYSVVEDKGFSGSVYLLYNSLFFAKGW